MSEAKVADKQQNAGPKVSPDDDKRELTARWVITALLTTQSAAQIGSQESDYCDHTFERDEDGHPVLYATTLAGALRSCLNDQLVGYRSSSEAGVSQLIFGKLDGVDAHESKVIVFDSRASSPADTALRDGVYLEASTRLAADHYKYDREIMLPGVMFPLRFDMLISAEAEEQAVLKGFVLALEDLACMQADTAISLGARRTRGLGLCHATGFRAERYDLTSLPGWLSYAESGYEADALKHLPQEREHASPHDAVQSAWCVALKSSSVDQRKRLVFAFDLALESTLLIRTPGMGLDAPDDVHLTEAGHNLLSGTGFIGALKHQVRCVVNTLPFSAQDQKTLLSDLLGPDPDAAGDPHASRVTLSGEPQLRGARRYRQTRTAIDRLSSATVEAALFEEEPCVGGWMRFQISVRQPLWQNTDSDAPLLLLAARDLLESLISLGGEAGIGRGLVSGTVTATLKQPEEREQVFLMTTEEGVAASDIERFEALLLPLVERYGSVETTSVVAGTDS